MIACLLAWRNGQSLAPYLGLAQLAAANSIIATSAGGLSYLPRIQEKGEHLGKWFSPETAEDGVQNVATLQHLATRQIQP
jgi:hypothetical protein